MCNSRVGMGHMFSQIRLSQVGRTQTTLYSEGKGCLIVLMAVAHGDLRVQGLDQSLSAPVEGPPACGVSLPQETGLF